MGLIAAPMTDGRSAYFFNYELTEPRDARLANFPEAEQRAIVARHLAIRKARFEALRERVATPEAA